MEVVTKIISGKYSNVPPAMREALTKLITEAKKNAAEFSAPGSPKSPPGSTSTPATPASTESRTGT
jgi:hypothetical protein